MLANEVYEEYFLNASMSMQGINVGGFISKYDGVDLASNCIFPLYEKNDSHIENKIEEIESFLLGKDIIPIYRIVYQDNYQRLDRLLFNKHYEKIAQSVVLACKLEGKKNELFRFANFNEDGILIFENIEPNDDFLDEYFITRDFDKNERFIFNKSIEISPLEKYALILVQECHLIGQAYFLAQGNVVILKDIVVSAKYRGLGYSSKILYAILTYALKCGAELVLAEVPLDNENVVNLFERNPMFVKLYDVFYRQLMSKSKGRFIFD